MERISAYITSFIIILVVAIVPSDVTKETKTPWYECIKPAITPPRIVFPIVWTILYILIAIALAECFIVHVPKEQSGEKTILLVFFTLNLILNVSWSFIYFGFKNVTLAFINIILLLVTQIGLMIYVWRLLPTWVFYILIPYSAWLIFASILNMLSLFNINKCMKYIKK